MLDKEKGDKEKRNERLGNASVVDDAAAAQKPSSQRTGGMQTQVFLQLELALRNKHSLWRSQ